MSENAAGAVASVGAAASAVCMLATESQRHMSTQVSSLTLASRASASPGYPALTSRISSARRAIS